MKMLTADLVKLDDNGAPWSDREIARRCKVGYTLVGKLRDETSFDTARADSMGRTFTHPKTGKPTVMNTANIGKSKKKAPPGADTAGPGNRAVGSVGGYGATKTLHIASCR